MIKFHCPQCSQKLGVPDEYAGKRVRCSKCSQACHVPAAAEAQAPQIPQAAALAAVPMKPSAPAQQTAKPAIPRQAVAPAPPQLETVQTCEAGNPFAGLQFDDGGPKNEALAAARQERYKQSAKISRSKSSAPKSSGPGRFSGVATGAGKIPLSIAASFGFMLGVCILWTVVAVFTGLNFFIFPWLVAAAGASGLVMFTEKRNVGLGLLSIAMALFGILMGKVMIAKWVIMSDDISFAELSQDEKNDLMEDPVLVYDMGAMDLWAQGQFDETVAKSLIMENVGEESDDFGDEDLDLESNESPALTETAESSSDTVSSPEYAAQHDAVCSHIEKWTPQERQQAFEQQYDKYQSCISSWFIISPIGFALALLFAFSIWDLAIIPASLVTAYKIGVGSDLGS